MCPPYTSKIKYEGEATISEGEDDLWAAKMKELEELRRKQKEGTLTDEERRRLEQLE